MGEYWRSARLSGHWKWIASAVLLGLAFLLVTVLNYHIVVTVLGGMVNKDFMSVWTGGKALVLGLDPYDPEVWPVLRTQYGSTWFPDPTCPFPLWTLMFFVPLSLLPLPVAGAIWTTVCEVSLVVSIPLLLGATRSNQSATVRVVMLLGALAFRPFIASLVNGQMVPVLLPVLAGSAYLYSRGQSFWSGVLMSLLITKPNLFPLFFIALGLLLLVRKDWSGLGGLAAGGGALLVTSWIISPGWLFRWLRVGVDKTTRVFGTPTLWGLSYELVGGTLWTPVAAGVAILLSLLTLVLVFRWRKEWLSALGLALCASLLVTPYMRAYDHILLLLPAVTAAMYGQNRRPSKLAIWLGIIVVLPWVLFGIAIARGFDQWSVLVTIVTVIYLFVSTRSRGASDS